MGRSCNPCDDCTKSHIDIYKRLAILSAACRTLTEELAQEKADRLRKSTELMQLISDLKRVITSNSEQVEKDDSVFNNDEQQVQVSVESGDAPPEREDNAQKNSCHSNDMNSYYSLTEFPHISHNSHFSHNSGDSHSSRNGSGPINAICSTPDGANEHDGRGSDSPDNGDSVAVTISADCDSSASASGGTGTSCTDSAAKEDISAMPPLSYAEQAGKDGPWLMQRKARNRRKMSEQNVRNYSNNKAVFTSTARKIVKLYLRNVCMPPDCSSGELAKTIRDYKKKTKLWQNNKLCQNSVC